MSKYIMTPNQAASIAKRYNELASEQCQIDPGILYDMLGDRLDRQMDSDGLTYMAIDAPQSNDGRSHQIVITRKDLSKRLS